MRTPVTTFGTFLLSAAALAACVDPSSRISTELTRYGIAQTQADCVGQRLERRLSIGQLQQLARAARAATVGDDTPGRLTASDLVRVRSKIDDPKIPYEVVSAASGCGLDVGAAIGGFAPGL